MLIEIEIPTVLLAIVVWIFIHVYPHGVSRQNFFPPSAPRVVRAMKASEQKSFIWLSFVEAQILL